jgi:hypothetical protein
LWLIKSGFTTLTNLATFTDAVVKTIAVIVGALWVLNRHYTSRVDVPQLRVDADVSAIPSHKFQNQAANHSLLIFRLDVVNTGKILIPPSQQYLEIHGVVPTEDGVQHILLSRWPSEGTHPSGQIEPGSWNAINNAISIPSSVQAVRFYISIQWSKSGLWTWHKTFDISPKAG